MSMLSRVAANVYWMGRYIERAENTARLINVNTNLLLDLPQRVRLGWEPIVEIIGGGEAYEQLEGVDERNVIRFLVASPANPSSILSSLSIAREDARTVRDIIPREAWEQINQLYFYVKDDVNRVYAQRTRYDFLRNVILGAQTITGLLAGTMTHDESYAFLRLGRNLERADMGTRIIDVRSASLLPETTGELTPFENIQWMSVLKSMTGYQMYRRTMRLRIRRSDVLRFLLQVESFPRSFAHCTGEIIGCLHSLPRNEKPLALVESLSDSVRRIKTDKLEQEQLHATVDKLQLGLAKINNELVRNYF